MNDEPSSAPQSWGIPDFAWCWLAGVLGAILASLPATVGVDITGRLYLFGVLLPAQQAATIAAVIMVSRAKGRGSLRRDFGFGIRWSQAWVAFTAVPLAFMLGWITAPLMDLADQTEAAQGIVQELQDSSGLLLSLAILMSTSILAPVMEELLFRGLLLRALRKRMTAGWSLFISSAVFGFAHLFDSAEAMLVVPGLMAFGAVLGLLALRDGSLSRPIFLHAGFNLLTVVASLSST